MIQRVMRNWEQEHIEKKHMLTCYVSPGHKERIKALARARRVSISRLVREMVELSLLQLEATRDVRDHPTDQAEPEVAELAPTTKAASVDSIDGVLRWLASQHEGNINDATYWAAKRLREAGVTLEHAQALLVFLAVALGLPAHEAERTIARAYSQHAQSTSP